MKVIFTKKDLLTVLDDMNRVVPTHVTSPVMRTVRIEATNDDSVDFLAVTGEVTLRHKLIDVGFGDNPADIIEPGVVVIYAKEIREIVKRLSGKQVSFAYSSEGMLIVKSERSKFELQTFDSKTFKVPSFKDTESTCGADLNAKDLKRLIKQSTYACSTSSDRPALQGVQLSIGEGLSAVSSDRFRLAYSHVDTDVEMGTRSSVIPASWLDHLAAMLPNDDDEIVNLVLADNHCTASWNDGETSLRIQAIDAKFPDLTRIWPVGFAAQYTVNRAVLIEALERVLIISHGTENQVAQFEAGDAQLKLRSQDPVVGKVEDSVEAIVEGEAFRLGFNVKFLLEAIKSLDGETIKVKPTGPATTPIQVEADNPNQKAIVLPVRITSAISNQTA